MPKVEYKIYSRLGILLYKKVHKKVHKRDIFEGYEKLMGGQNMIRGLILFYLNIKPTHGYEIQRFIQLSGVDKWSKIQSGSIYYALSKLENENNIAVLKEERTGTRVRKIFMITELGKTILYKEMQEALAAPIVNIGSMKFITAPILSTLPKKEMITILSKHISELKDQKEYWELWKKSIAGEKEPKLIHLSFKMAIDSIGNQILWHEELLDNLDENILESSSMRELIETFDVDRYEVKEKEPLANDRVEFASGFKEAMKKDPKTAIVRLNRIIEELKSQI